jgi:hypothetical protein
MSLRSPRENEKSRFSIAGPAIVIPAQAGIQVFLYLSRLDTGRSPV